MADGESDTFARFVDVVADSLDEPVDGDVLAARLHFSRPYVDRVITAVGGEPPGRFRRRIRLERAAYRLLTRDSTLLDIAVEAGYSSHEAFTRAFQRDYGAAPSVWRRRPGPPLLPSPTGVHFHPPGGLRLPAARKVTSMDLVVTMTEHHIWLIGEMLDLAARLDDTALDAQIEISVEGIDRDPTIRSLLSRLVGQLDMWNCAVANRPYDFSVEEQETLDSMRARLAEAGPVYLERVRHACADNGLEETFVDATGEQPTAFTYGQMIAHVITYAAHRRTIVTGALYTAGQTELDDDPLFYAPLMP